jgi:molecular chaperone DnaK
MYAEQAQPADGAAQQAEPEAKHDDVVDAEFEEVKEDQKK